MSKLQISIDTYLDLYFPAKEVEQLNVFGNIETTKVVENNTCSNYLIMKRLMELINE